MGLPARTIAKTKVVEGIRLATLFLEAYLGSCVYRSLPKLLVVPARWFLSKVPGLDCPVMEFVDVVTIFVGPKKVQRFALLLFQFLAPGPHVLFSR